MAESNIVNVICKNGLKHKWFVPTIDPFFFLTENKDDWEFWFQCDRCKINRHMKLTYKLKEL